MKKHFVIFIFTLAALLFLNQFWIPRGISLSFDYKLDHPVELEFFYASDADDAWAGHRMVRHKTSTKEGKAEIFLPVLQLERLRIDPGSKPVHVVMRNMRLQGEDTLILGSKKHDFRTRNIAVKNESEGEVRVASKHADPILVYNKPLSMQAGQERNFNLLNFLIVIFTPGYLIYAMSGIWHDIRNNKDSEKHPARLNIDETDKLLVNHIRTERTSKRIAWLDIARAVSIILVVLTHASEQAGFPDLNYKSIIYSIDRVGVPIFFMLSGALILPKAAKLSIGEYYARYYRRIIQFVVLFFLYTVATNFVSEFCIKNKGCCDAFEQALLFNGLTAKGAGAAIQMWYMPFIIGFYVFAPYIARFVVNTSTHGLYILVGIMVLPFFDIHFLKTCMGSVICPFVIYYILGYLFIQRLQWKATGWLNAACLSVWILCGAIALWIDCTNDKFMGWIHWYRGSFTILISGVALLVLLRNLFEKKTAWGWVTHLSKCAFGIYLVHHAILLGIKSILPPDSTQLVEYTLLYMAIVLALSWVFTALLARIPYLKKLVV